MNFNYTEIEAKWKKHWQEEKTYKVHNDYEKPKYYVLDMFPYPSGAGLHVGHPLGYIASDIFARFKRMSGYNVLHPMGYDAFGLPAEQYAIQTGIHPAVSTSKNIDKYRNQLDNLGFNYDWDREVRTNDPAFYKWTQWIFLKLFNSYYDKDGEKAYHISALISKFESQGSESVNAHHNNDIVFSGEQWNTFSDTEKDEILMDYRLAYRREAFVNWCPALGTVLANDEVKDGVSERGGFPVEKKAMMQWSLRITAYAERLINGLDEVDWSDALKTQQKNWIGRSEGAQIFFQTENPELEIEVYTTRPDTIFGATFMVLAPEHDFREHLVTEEQKEEVETYLAYVAGRSEVDRMSENKAVTGVFTGSYAIHPFNDKKLPIYLAEYVLKDYGTGAIMAVPSDDERDNRFATKFDIDIIPVVDQSNHPEASIGDKVGVMINSDILNGFDVKEAITTIIKRIEEKGIGSGKTNYKLRDANYGRQRYWGEPFPIVYDNKDIAIGLDEDQLPLELPDLDDFKPAEGGKSPLARLDNWVNLKNGMKRETDTMPGYAGSSWYFLRYMDARNSDEFASKDAIDYWKQVDLYIGGTEHAVGHLMYSRFWHKFLYDQGLVPTREPFKRLVNQGMIQGVIEFMYLKKEKEEGFNKFMCAGLVGEDHEQYAKIPVLIDFVKDYGTNASYLNINSIKKFIDWRPEYEDAVFECANGIYHQGVFNSKVDKMDSQLMTISEVGKMSKRYYNVVNPDLVVDQYGADTFRMYEMFLGPIEQSKPWDTKGIEGVSKFIRRFWGMFFNEEDAFYLSNDEASKEELKILHRTIKKVTEDIENLSFNTAVSAFMVAINELKKINCNKKSILVELCKLLSPFAPFVCEELWERMGHKGSIHHVSFPEHDDSFLVEDSIQYPLSVNGKKRALASYSTSASKEEIEKMALNNPDLQKWIEGHQIIKVIVVPNRMVNIVVK